MEKFTELLQRRIWLGPLIAVLIGILLGLVLGWVVWPITWAPGPDDVASMADAYHTNPAAAATYAKTRLAGLSKDEQSRLFIASRTKAGNTLQAGYISALAQTLGVNLGPDTAVPPGPTPAGATPPRPTTSPSTPTAGALNLNAILPYAIGLVVVVLVVAVALILLMRIRSRSKTDQGEFPPVANAGTPIPPPMRAMPPTGPTTTPGGLGRFVASYALGNDNYDTSFSLETPRQEFLGECGMGISETIGEGKPDKVTAFDLWLFDKADVRTVTQIIMSEYAFNDRGLRAKLAAKGEAILAEKGKVISLETQSLRIAAQIVELSYATNPSFPPNSHFQKLTVEIIPSLKEMVAA